MYICIPNNVYFMYICIPNNVYFKFKKKTATNRIKWDKNKRFTDICMKEK